MSCPLLEPTLLSKSFNVISVINFRTFTYRDPSHKRHITGDSTPYELGSIFPKIREKLHKGDPKETCNLYKSNIVHDIRLINTGRF